MTSCYDDQLSHHPLSYNRTFLFSSVSFLEILAFIAYLFSSGAKGFWLTRL